MQGRLRILILLLVVVIIVAVVFLVLSSQSTTPSSPATNPTTTDTTTDGGNGNTTTNVVSDDEPTATPIAYANIWVAVQEITRGQIIAPNQVELRPWPVEFLPFGAFEEDSGDSIIGNIARTDIFIEQPILSNMIVANITDGDLAEVGSDAAAVLPNNRVAIAVPMDRLTSVAYAIKPGDRVDIIISLLFVDIDPDFQSIEPNEFTLYSRLEDPETGVISYQPSGNAIPGNFETRPGAAGDVVLGVTSPSEDQRPRLVTQRTVQDALVIWLGDFPDDGRIFRPPATPTPIPSPTPVEAAEEDPDAPKTPTPTPIPPRPDIITLGVTPQDAVVLTWFIEARLPITFALRSATTTSQVLTEDVSLDYIMSTFNIELPGKRPFGIQPAITSIRELIAGERIELKTQ